MNQLSVFKNTKVGIKIVLYTSKKNKQNLSPIMLRLTADGKQKYISLKLQIEENDWDFKNSKVKSSHTNSNEYNAIIANAYNDAEQNYLKLFNKVESSLSNVQNAIRVKADKKTVEDVIKDRVKHFEKLSKFSSAEILSYTLVIMSRPLRECKIDKISEDWVKKFIENITTQYNFKGNGVSIYLRSLKACFRDYYGKESHLVSEYFKFSKLTSTDTPKRAITTDRIKKSVDLKFEADTNLNKRGLGIYQQELSLAALERSRNVFILSILLNGINFKDLALLKKTDVIDGRIEWCRNKTGSIHTVVITDTIKKLLDKLKTDNEMLLPIITDTKYINNFETKAFYVYYKTKLKRHNANLKKLGKLIEIDTPLTTYVGRHSFATMLNDNSVSLSVIQQALGHSNIKTTQAYLSKIDNTRMDEATNKITELIGM
ncbi:MAG: tyrosine-type recombinase/integrase [Bacteroidota bacterium]